VRRRRRPTADRCPPHVNHSAPRRLIGCARRGDVTGLLGLLLLNPVTSSPAVRCCQQLAAAADAAAAAAAARLTGVVGVTRGSLAAVGYYQLPLPRPISSLLLLPGLAR